MSVNAPPPVSRSCSPSFLAPLYWPGPSVPVSHCTAVWPATRPSFSVAKAPISSISTARRPNRAAAVASALIQRFVLRLLILILLLLVWLLLRQGRQAHAGQ